MGRPRKHDKHLPSNVLHRHGAYYHVKQGKWTRLSDNYSDALIALSNLVSEEHSGTLATLIDKALKSKKKTLSKRSWNQYQSAAKRLKEISPDFAVEDLKPINVKRMKRDMVEMQVTFNIC